MMEWIGLLVQLVTGVYVVQQLIDQGVSPIESVSVVCIYLVVYLLGCVVRGKRVQVALKILSVVYLIGMIWGGLSILFVQLIACIGSWCKAYEKRLVVVAVVVGIGTVGAMVPDVLGEQWMVVGLLGMLCYCQYRYRAKVVLANKHHMMLMEKVRRLNGELEAVECSKSELAYMTRVSERNAIANRLHDQLGHVLAGSKAQD